MAVELSGDSPHAIALRLTELIALQEGKSINVTPSGADRKYTLDLYKECIDAVLSVRRWGPFAS